MNPFVKFTFLFLFLLAACRPSSQYGDGQQLIEELDKAQARVKEALAANEKQENQLERMLLEDRSLLRDWKKSNALKRSERKVFDKIAHIRRMLMMKVDVAGMWNGDTMAKSMKNPLATDKVEDYLFSGSPEIAESLKAMVLEHKKMLIDSALDARGLNLADRFIKPSEEAKWTDGFRKKPLALVCIELVNLELALAQARHDVVWQLMKREK